MGLTTGSRLGPYVLESRLGAGGMGEVFKARDSRLDRSVAIKVLPDQFARDPQRRARFEREARTVSQLNHPRICMLHDIGQHEGTMYLVMELIDGQTLSDRLARGPLPLQDVLRYGAEIAEALDAAHRAGVIHRDLKPANIMITRSGAKLLDFGLARPAAPQRSKHDDPTAVQHDITSAGMIVGTLPYMAPEQLQEQEADARTDIFAFGAVLYEMLTGRRAFNGSNPASLIAMILQQQPGRPSELQSLTPPAVEHIVMTCLQKEPDLRYQCTADVAHELRWLAQAGGGEASSSPAVPLLPSNRGWKVATAAALLFALVAGGVAAYRLSQTPEDLRPQFTQLTFESGEEQQPTISPDGKLFAFVKRNGGQRDIFLQRIDGRSAINLTPDAPADDHQPAFSPDGSQIAFRSERDGGGIFVMGATGESVRRLTSLGHNPAWSPDGKELVFSGQEAIDPASLYGIPNLYAVDVTTSAMRVIHKANNIMQPSWSPSGDRIAFWTSRKTRRDLYLIDRDGDPQSLQAVTSDLPIDWNPVWSPDGKYLYFSSDRDGVMGLWRIAVDEKKGKKGEPEALGTPSQYAGFLSIAASGDDLVYQSSSQTGELLRLSVDPVAERVTEVGAPVFSGSTRFRSAVLSPDGRFITYTNIGPQEDVFVMAADGTGLRQLTNDLHRDRGASWWPDGSRIAFYSTRSGRYDLWSIRPDGSGLMKGSDFEEGVNFPRVSPDATRVAYIADNGTGVRIARLDASGGATASEPIPPVPPEGFLPRAWSPDGKLLAGGSWGPDGASLTIYSLERRSFTRLPVAAYAAAFIDNANLMFVDEQQRIGITDVAGREVRVIGAVPPGDGYKLRQASVSDDARTVVVYRSRTESDVWRVSLGVQQPRD